MKITAKFYSSFVVCLLLIFSVFFGYIHSVHASHYSGGLTRPSGLTPLVVSPSQVSGNVVIRWNAVSGADAYNIFVDNMNNRDATDCASPASGDKCYSTKATSVTITNIVTTVPYKVSIQAIKTNPNNANVPYLGPLAVTWLNVPSYRVIAGYVKDTKGNPVVGVKIAVQSGDVRYAFANTDSTGKFQVSNHIKYGDTYAVRVSAVPTGYVSPAKTSGVGWNWNFCTNPNWTGGKSGIDPALYNHPWGDTPAGSGSYECQLAGSQIDCAGPENTSAFTAGRCSFVLSTAIVPTPTSFRVTQTPPPSLTPTKAAPTPTPVLSCPVVPVDIAIMLDRSSSMWNKTTRDPSSGVSKDNLQWAKDAALSFVNAFKSTGAGQAGNIRVSIGSFAKTASSTSFYPVNTGYSEITSAISNISKGDTGSCLECGVYSANVKLKDAGLNNNNSLTKKVVIFLSDGRANYLRSGSSTSHTTGGNKAISEANKGRNKSYVYPIVYFVNGYGAKVSEADGGILEWVLKGPAQDTSLGNLGIANGTGSPYYKYEQDAFDWDTVFKSFQDTICTSNAFRAQAASTREVAGASTNTITIDKDVLKQRISDFVDALFKEFNSSK